jgi:hypothetical protein
MVDELDQVLGIALQWHKLAQNDATPPDDEIFRFVALWVAFNALYALAFPKAKTEYAQLKSFANWSPARKAHAAALAAADPGYKGAIETLKDRGVYNFLADRTEHISSPEDLAQVIECVYRVRSNLFHGRKAPADLRVADFTERTHPISTKGPT